MDSSAPDPQQQPPQQPHSHPHVQNSYYSQTIQGYGAAYQQPSHEPPGPTTVPSQTPGQSESYDIRPELTPAAAAAVMALSELSEFAGSTARQETENSGVAGPGPGLFHYHHPDAPHYALSPGMNDRGLFRGRRRGRGRGRGRHMGRGRGRGSVNPTQAPQTEISSAKTLPTESAPSEKLSVRTLATESAPSEKPSAFPTPASQAEISSAKTLTTTSAPSKQSVPQIFWCEICLVDCDTLDILEIHTNGKRHKRTVKKREEMQAWKKLQLENVTKDIGTEILRAPQNQSELTIDTNHQIETILPENEKKENVQEGCNVQEATVEGKNNDKQGQQTSQEIAVPAVEEIKNAEEEQQKLQEAMVPEVDEEKIVQDAQQNFQEAKVVTGNDFENLKQNQSIDLQPEEMEKKLTSEQPTNDASSFPRRDGQAERNLNKRNMTGCDPSDKRARHMEPSEKHREQPVVCTICNISCNSKAIFQTHLVGKKHISRVVTGNDFENLKQNQSIDLQPEEMEKKLTSEQPTNDASSFPRRDGQGERNLNKRKMTGCDPSDKRARHMEPLGRKPSEKHREQPVVCTICNISCNSKAIFQTHLVGKKHISRVKRFPGLEAASGSPGFFLNHPQYTHSSVGPPPMFYGFPPPEASHQNAHVTITEEAYSEQAVEALSEVAEPVSSEDLNIILDSSVQKVKSAEQISAFEGDNIKLDCADGSLASDQ